jgi:hypothetical protein
MPESQNVVVERLIARNAEALVVLRTQLHDFEVQPGSNRASTQQEIQRLKLWIKERESLEIDLNDLRMGRRDWI